MTCALRACRRAQHRSGQERWAVRARSVRRDRDAVLPPGTGGRGPPGTLDSMSEQHYFSETPETEFKPRPVQVELAGRKVTVTTANGIFSPSGVDKGTAILLQEAPDPQGTRMLDIGCGWGPITLTLAMLAPQAQVHAVDVNSRSISLTERNAAALGLSNVTVGTPESVDPELRFDTIWSNPPIRVGKEVLHEILLTWLPRLAPGGDAYLVVQKNLGSDSLQKWMDAQLGQLYPGEFEVSRYATSKGFRILQVHRYEE